MTAPVTRVVVLAKEPLPGRSKTRLTPPYTPAEAARLAGAALRDTLDTVRELRDSEPGWDLLLSLRGTPGDWLPPDVPVVAQRDGGHDARIAGALQDAVARPASGALLVGMDTPQVTRSHLRAARAALHRCGAVLGPAADGGWWLLGLRAPLAARAPELVVGVPTSTPRTGQLQRDRLRGAGIEVASLPVLRDVDTAADVDLVRAGLERDGIASRFAALASRLRQERVA